VSVALPKVFWPLTITSTTNRIPVRYAGVTYNADIAAAVYYSAETFRAAVAAALAAAVPALGFSVSLGLAFPGSLTFFGSAAFSFWWASAPTNIAAAACGFNSGLDSNSSGNQIVSSFQHPNGWYSAVAVAADDPTKSREGDRVTVAMSGQTKRIVETEITKRAVGFQFIEGAHTFIARETGTSINSAAERWWGEGAGRFRYWPDASVEATYTDYVLAQETIVEWKPQRMAPQLDLYRFDLNFLGYVA